MQLNTITLGDCREILALLPENSVDAVVTDPPYELGFMGKSWDKSGVAFEPETWRQVLRVLKPGGHLLAFGGSRTSHRIAVAIEDAGFEIRDVLQWIYGSGFPKSLDVSKAIDKAAGAERPVVGENPYNAIRGQGANEWGNMNQPSQITAPATDAAKQWQGWGTALKPAHEPIIMARKPLSEKTVAKNVLLHGTGGINVDACRIGAAGGCKPAEDYDLPGGIAASKQLNSQKSMPVDGLGRWPSNVILSEEAAAELDLQSGVTKSKASRRGLQNSGQAGGLAGEERNAKEGTDTVRGHSDTGGASRFFYVAKASRSERNAGGAENGHPTVKPLALMQQLIRLVTPPGGVVLDPFTGSGSTLAAAASLGFAYTGVELSEEYIAIAEARVKHWTVAPTEEAVPAVQDEELLDFAL
jgi:DNA modification methylase